MTRKSVIASYRNRAADLIAAAVDSPLKDQQNKTPLSQMHIISQSVIL
jgi:hypothetical protein